MTLLDKEPVQRVSKKIREFDQNLSVSVLETSARTALEAASSLGCKVGAIVKSLLFKTDDKFTLSATSVPSGWRVLFINGNVFEVEAGRILSVPIKVEVSDEARDGDQESITISIYSDISNQEKQQSFIVDVEQGFTARLTTAISDLWYIFVFFALIIVVGAISYNQQEDDWDYDDDEEYESPASSDSVSPSNKEVSSNDDWDDWD